MTMVFERDDKGLLHQVEMSLEDIAAAGRNINLTMAQQFYVLFTPDEEKALAAQRAALKAEEDNLKSEALKRQEALIAEQDAEAARLASIEQAKKDEQDARDQALMLALDKLKILQAKVDALTNPTLAIK